MTILLDTNICIGFLNGRDARLRDKVPRIHDLKIAAIALAADVTLITRNQGECQRVPGLLFEVW